LVLIKLLLEKIINPKNRKNYIRVVTDRGITLRIEKILRCPKGAVQTFQGYSLKEDDRTVCMVM
jgi:hypothetical protein